MKASRISLYNKTDKEIKHETQVKQAKCNGHSHPGSKPAKNLKTAFKYRGGKMTFTEAMLNGLR